MKYLILGLGNVGTKYDKTRHNVGFDVLDKLAEQKKVSFELKKLAHVAETTHKGKKMILVKPTTYMNLSGKALRYWMNEHKVNVENVLVVVDDIALPVGKLRLKPKGSDAGHNGLKNIQDMIGTPKYPRLKFGVGNDFKPGQQSDFVLGTFSSDDRITVELSIDKSVEAILSFVFSGLQNTMNKFN